MFGAAEKMLRLLEKSMDQWKTELTAGVKILCTVDTSRGIFQGTSLSPLLFVVVLIALSMVLRETKAGYDQGNRKGVINHRLFMDGLKLKGKNEKQMDTLVNTL